MIKLPGKYLVLSAVLFGAVAMFGTVARAQDVSAAAARASTENPVKLNLDVQIQVLVASNGGSDAASLPVNLSSVAREIRNNLQASQVRLGATFQSRVEVDTALQVSGVVTSSIAMQPTTPQTPVFYSYNIGKVRLAEGGSNSDLLQLDPFRFSLRIPVQAAGSAATGYESVGITTNATVRIGEPTIIGTLGVGRADETIVIIVTAKRASPR